MKNVVLWVCFAGTVLTPLRGFNATEGQVHLRQDRANVLLEVQGDKDDEWRFQFSSDLGTWTNLTALGTVFSGKTNPPSVVAGSLDASQGFYRAVKTTGLYDIAVLRTVSLTFTQANWQTLLANGRTTGSNTVGDLILDNGAAVSGIGARYRGNTSYSGMGQGGAPAKKSINLEVDFTDTAADVMGYNTLNLNNAYGDETLMREPLYFYVMQHYTVCPQGSMVRLYINGDYWGVYSFAQQENGDLIRQWCPSYDGDLWRAPNMAGMPGGGPGGRPPGGGGTTTGGASALSYLGTNLATYQANYELKTDHSSNAWQSLIHATDVLNNTPTNQLRDKVEDVLAVDRWLWFLAIENIFADDDSYFNKGADYGFYHEPESGRIHPVEHDGNESFMSGDVSLSPVQGAGDTGRPVLYRLLRIPELRQRYLAHMRTVLEEFYNPGVMNALIDQLSALSYSAIAADTKKGFTMTAHASDVTGLKTFIANRYKYLTNHAELRPVPPRIASVLGPAAAPTPLEVPVITAQVSGGAGAAVDSVWLYYRAKSFGRFSVVQMLDDGAHGDGSADDGVFGASTVPYPAGTKVRYYVEARSANSAKAACFSPARAEEDTCNYRVGLAAAATTPVVINELMASNQGTLADPQGEYDDWIELLNITDQKVDLSGRYLTDDPNNPRKWSFPEGTVLPAGAYLLVWADEDGSDTTGLHANFKLSADGEQVLLIDTDANGNLILDSVFFGAQERDLSYGRSPESSNPWKIQIPTPEKANDTP